MKKEDIYIGNILKLNSENETIISEREAILIKVGNSFVALDSIYSTLPFAIRLFNIVLRTYPTKNQPLFIDENSLKKYFPEEEKKESVSLKKLKINTEL